MHKRKEDRFQAIEKINAAIAQDDWSAAIELTKQKPLVPEVANAFKNTFGIDFLTRNGYNLSDAEKKYGKDWLLQ